METITYDRARQLVLERITAQWRETPGTPWAAAEGLADDQSILVPWGAKEFLVDGRDEYALATNLAFIVDRVTGVVEPLVVSDNLGRFLAMEPIAAETQD